MTIAAQELIEECSLVVAKFHRKVDQRFHNIKINISTIISGIVTGKSWFYQNFDRKSFDLLMLYREILKNNLLVLNL